MPFNLSSAANSKRIGIGTGTLFLRPFDGVTPSSSDDVGMGRGAQLSVTRQRIEVLQGVPRSLIVQYAIQEDVSLTFTSIEWNATNIQRLLGGASVSGSATDATMLFGGAMGFLDLAARFTHQMPAGGTVTLDLHRCQGSGELQLNFADDVHELPFNLRALIQTTSWGGDALAANSQLFRLRVTIA